MPSHRYWKISIIGAGGVGSSLGAALHAKGYPFVSIINRTGAAAIDLAKSLKCKKASPRVSDIDPSSEIVLIAVPDDALPRIVKQLACVKRLKFAKLFVAHTSGVHSSSILEPIRRKGALVASMHPVQTFPALLQRSTLHGIYFGIDGAPPALARARTLAADLQAKTVVIPDAMKPLYHVASVFSSSYLVAILNVIQQISRTLGLNESWTDVFGPLMTRSMENTLKHSAAGALTGPVMRRDLSTISMHLESLTTYAPQFLPLYLVGGLEITRIAVERGKLSEEDSRTIVQHFRKFLTSIPPPKKSKGKQ